MTLPDLSHLVPSERIDVERVWPDQRAIITHAIDNAPRSLQKTLGPSEYGCGCDRCLALLLAGRRPTEATTAWLPFVGTAVHAMLAEFFAAANAGRPVRWLSEMTVTVGQLRGQDITGHCDLIDLASRTVIDFKVVGATTLKKVKASGPTDTYRRQIHSYARGAAARGIPVEHVQIVFLPRNAISIDAGHVWTQPYDEQVALDALARANAIAAGVDALGIDAVLTQMPPHTGREFTCTAWGPTDPAPNQGADTSRQLAGLIA